ncbi:MAG: hypothetical protein ACQERB_01635 [Promethearchaeati archaeon]
MNFPTPKLKNIFQKKFPIDGILSIWGDFGVGKTTLALQISILSIEKRKKVIYFYTKPNFPYKKLFTLAEDNFSQDISPFHSLFDLITIKDFSQLYSIILNLEYLFLTEKNYNLKTYLIVIDSLTDLYKSELNFNNVDQNVRLNYQLNQILATLKYLKHKYDLDLLIINETSRTNQIGEIKETQSGGKVMEYWITDSIKIERTNVLNKRKFKINRFDKNKNYEIILKINETGFE